MKPSLGIVFIFCAVGVSVASASVLSSQPELTYTKAVYSLPLTYDPTEMNDEASLIASSLIYDGLLAFTPALRIEGALAESWKTSRDGNTLTFKLRPNVQFHNGEKLNATTVVRSLERAVRPGSTVFKLYDCIQGADEYFSGKSKNVRGLKVVDNLTVQIELKNPFPPFLSVLAGATAKILPSGVFTDPEFFKKPIGTGPFKFEQINKTEIPEVVLARNESYPLKPAKIEKLILREISEVDAQSQAKSGLIQDLSSYPLKGTEDVFSSGQKVTVSTAATWIIGLSSTLKPFDSLAIREKFRSSVNTEAFRKRFHPTSLEARGYIPPGIPGFSKTSAVSKTKSLGEIPKDKVTIAIPSELENANEMKSFFEEQFKSHGWNVLVVPTPWNDLMRAYKEKTLQGFLVSMNMDYPDAEFLLRNFESNNPDNFSGISDKKIDQKLKEARNIQDRTQRQSLYQEVAKRINELALTINLFHPRVSYWLDSCVRGFEPNYLSAVYIDYRPVEIDRNCAKKQRGRN